MEKLAIVVPCYNEEQVLQLTNTSLLGIIENLIQKGKIDSDSFIFYVDDGSKDNTWNIIEKFYKENKHTNGLKLAGNVGHQNALTSGLIAVKDVADIIISIDADLQDDINMIEAMVDKYHEGNDIVYGVRNDRRTDSFFKRNTAKLFYKTMKIMGIKSVYNHADFRLMSKRAVEQFSNYKEINLFLRGIIPLLGYKTEKVFYERKERTAGESKYPLKKMLALAFEGITSFSIRPIKIVFYLGCIIIMCSITAAIYALISYITGKAVAGWTSLILSIWFIGGVQLLSIGLIGTYIGKIYMEVKHRPRYNIEINSLNQHMEINNGNTEAI